ncbi:MAG: hypothetical protein HY787_23630 [Deltaproteobacteria bacterium]|nr:hypothetical protein [Deltaproteobacteria bacterium]
MGIKNKTHIIMAVWGRDYLDLFLKVSLPSQLSPGNIPALEPRDGIQYNIFTTEEDAAVIRHHPAFNRLASMIKTEIIFFNQIAGDNKFAPLMRLHNQAIKKADLENAALIFLSPDFILSDGTLSRLIQLKQEGYRAVLLLTLRLSRETFIPDLLSSYPPGDDRSITIAPRELSKIALSHLHPIEQTYVWGKTLSSFPIHAYWPVEDEGLVARCFFLHPIMVNPLIKFISPQITVDADYLDLVCPDISKIYFVRDSDEMACFEMTGQSVQDANAKGPPLMASAWSCARWANIHANPVFTSPLHHYCFQVPIRIHRGQFSPKWMRQEKVSRRIARRVKWFLLILRRSMGAAFFYYLFFPARPLIINEGQSRPGRFLRVDLSGRTSNPGWGKAEQNQQGQKWRWVGQAGKAQLFLPLKKTKLGYLLKTHLHTALGRSLYDLKVEVNGYPSLDPRIVRKGEKFWHCCCLPNQMLKEGNLVEITYQVDNKEMGPQIALSQVNCRPLIFSPGDLYRIYRRRFGRFLRKFIPKKTAN